MKKVMCMGTFDIFHPGHLSYFEQAKKLGDYLIVVLARDQTIKKERGKQPKINENDRLKILKHIDLIDEAVLGNLGDKLKIVEEKLPNLICLGYDQKVDQDKLEQELKSRNLNVKVIRLNSYKENEYKSSKLK